MGKNDLFSPSPLRGSGENVIFAHRKLTKILFERDKTSGNVILAFLPYLCKYFNVSAFFKLINIISNLMLVPIDFLSSLIQGSLWKLAEGQFFMGALDQWAEKINRNSAQLDENLAAGQQFYCPSAGHHANNSIVALLMIINRVTIELSPRYHTILI